jgi:hypothetical protein
MLVGWASPLSECIVLIGGCVATGLDTSCAATSVLQLCAGPTPTLQHGSRAGCSRCTKRVAAGYAERNEVLHKMELKRLSRSY